MMKIFKVKPRLKSITHIDPYYLSYSDKKEDECYAQYIGAVETKYAAVKGIIMRVKKRESFLDFGRTCTGLNLKHSGWIIRKN